MAVFNVEYELDTVSDNGKGLRLGRATTSKVGLFGVTPVVQQTALTTQLTSLSGPGSSPGTPDYAIQALTNTGPFGFATADEGETVISVILNLQTRVAELETKLQALGALA